MKKFILLSLSMFIFSSTIYSQMQKGDKSVNFQASLSSSSGNTTGWINGALGYNFTKHWRVIAGPSIQIGSEQTGVDSTGQISTSVKVHFGLALDVEYYFSTKSKLSPFAAAGFYFPDFSQKEVALLFGGGVNYYISKNISWRNVVKMGEVVVTVDIPATPYTNATTMSSSSFLFLFQTGLEFKF